MRFDDRWRIGGVFLVLYLAVEVVLTRGQPFPSNFDELEHLSYVASLARFGAAASHFSPSFLLGKEWGSGFTTNANYINHPPLFYLVLRLLLSSRAQPDYFDVTVLAVRECGNFDIGNSLRNLHRNPSGIGTAAIAPVLHVRGLESAGYSARIDNQQ